MAEIIVPERKLITNPSLADRAVAFINALKHTKGEWHGKNFELLPWQETIVRDVFGTVKENGYRQYTVMAHRATNPAGTQRRHNHGTGSKKSRQSHAADRSRAA